MAGRGFYRKKKRKELSLKYLLVILILGFVMYKWGFSVLIELIAKTGDTGLRTEKSEDFIAPQTPIISALPEATNSGVLKVEGFTEAGVEVWYYINDRLIISENTDKNGFYQTILNLENGNNEIKVIAKDEADNESTSKPITVIYDFKNPEILLNTPTDNQDFFGQQEQSILVAGKISEPEASLRINNTYTRLDNNGEFSLNLGLNEGKNEIRLIVNDAAGNLSEKTISVNYAR